MTLISRLEGIQCSVAVRKHIQNLLSKLVSFNDSESDPPQITYSNSLLESA